MFSEILVLAYLTYLQWLFKVNFFSSAWPSRQFLSIWQGLLNIFTLVAPLVTFLLRQNEQWPRCEKKSEMFICRSVTCWVLSITFSSIAYLPIVPMNTGRDTKILCQRHNLSTQPLSLCLPLYWPVHRHQADNYRANILSLICHAKGTGFWYSARCEAFTSWMTKSLLE